jgi:hypothetical protein
MRFTRPGAAGKSTTRPWAAAAVALWLGGCGQTEVAKSPDLVQPVWRAPEAEAPVAATETRSDTSGTDPAAPTETNLDAPAPGADGSPGAAAEATEEAAPAQLEAADEPPTLEEPKPRSTAKASKSKKKKKKAKPKPAQ